MEILYSDILPLSVPDGKQTFSACFYTFFEKSDRVEIASGYFSKAALMELDNLMTMYPHKRLVLTIGMYYVEGIPESTYRLALDINRKWMDAGIGEIRVVRAFKYHGKTYAFYSGDTVHSAIIGSANLGAIKLEANNRRQYEISVLTTDPHEAGEIALHVSQLSSDACSINIADASGMPIIRELNASLTGVDTVDRLPLADVDLYAKHKTAVSFILPLKVPAFAERFMDDNRHYTKSNLNVSYAAPRSARKSRDWYETQFTVSKSITRLEGYPEKNKPFFVVTDDGYTFKAHTTSDGNKQFSAVGDELILGRWVKGRLAAAGLVTPVNDTQADTDRRGMITKEMLAAYGCDTLVITKTTHKKEDEDGSLLDVWVLSFEAGASAVEENV